MTSIMNRVGAGLFRILYRRRVKALEAIPGPIPTFPWGNGLDFFGQLPWQVCANYGKRYGGLSLTWLGSRPVLILNDAELIGQVLERDVELYYKAAPCRALRSIITSNSPFISNGSDWKTKRDQDPFQMEGFEEWLVHQIPGIRQIVTAHAQQLATASAEGPVELLDAVERLVFDTFAVAVVGRPLDVATYRQFLYLARVGDRRMKAEAAHLPLLPPCRPRFYRQRRRWRKEFSKLIEQARQNPNPHANDLMNVLLRRGTPLSNTALRDALANVFYGGVFSASSAITTTLYLLAQHPEHYQPLRHELRALMKKNQRLDIAALEASPRLDGVLRESLRYYTPVPLFFRSTLGNKPRELAGHFLPRKTTLFITNWALHRSPTHWKDPDRFDPLRWDHAGSQANPLGSGYFFPFGRGKRTCLGATFAMFSMKLILATLLSQLRVDIDPSQAYRQSYFFGVMMPQGLQGQFCLEE